METIYNIKTIKIGLKIGEPISGKISSPTFIYELAKGIYKDLDADQEHFIIFSLDSKNQVRGYKIITSGGQNSASPDPKIIFRNALLLGACGIILTHNHPSGDAEPSEEDLGFTKKLEQAGKMIDIDILDHLILGNTKYYSFKENRLI